MGGQFAQKAVTWSFLDDSPKLRILALILGLFGCSAIGLSIVVEQYILAFSLFALALAVFIFFYPYLGLLLFLGLIYARPQDTFPGFMGKPILFMLLSLTIGCWFVRVLVLRQREFVKAPQTLFFLALLSIATLSCVRVWIVSAKDAFMSFLKVIAIYSLVVNLIDTHRKFTVALWVMFFGTIYIAMLGILQHYGIAPEIAGTTPAENLGRIQGFGIFDSSNYLAYGVALMIPFGIYAFYYSTSWPAKLFSVLVVPALFLPCIQLTGSRGGLICAFLTISFCLFQARSLKISLTGALITIGVSFILLRMVPAMETVRYYQDDGSAMGRVEAWRAGFSMLKAFPLSGVGYGMFTDNWLRDSHNSFVQVGSELGFIGLFIWISLLYWSYKYLTAVIQNLAQEGSASRKAHAKSLRASLFAFAVGSCFASLGYYMLLYLLHSFAVVAGRLYLPEGKRREISKIRLEDLFIIGGIEVFVLCTWYIFPKL